ncbi:MAG TPA: PAS domain-containing sensor histidine kinase [Gammaproteobacteria bacterium]|nr:PAS domain-containing sensor histidine kinase [Gammaproteobacteria bacterium]
MKHNIRTTTSKNMQNTAEQLENIISLLPGHVYWKDRNGILLGCNNEQAKDIGLKSRHEVVGLTAYDTLPKELADAITQADNEIMTTGISKTVHEVLTLPDGKKSVWLSQKVPLYEGNEVIGLLGISLDVTEIEKTKRKLRATKHKLQAMTAVSASIAHELRTPLATIDLGVNGITNYFSAILAGYNMAREANLPVPEISQSRIKLIEQVLKSIKTEVRSAFNFIDMLLFKIKTSISAKSPEIFSMATCIQDSLARYPFQENESNLIILDLNQDFQTQGNALLITHVFFNLIKNAVYYIAASGKKANITISLRTGKHYNKVLFKDTGTGIAPEILPKIFDRFFSKTRHGAGVGLTFCKMVMQSLGGKIKCESVKGEYTLFTLSFPAIRNHKDTMP